MPIPTFVSVGTQAQTATGGGTSITPGAPAGSLADDIWVVAIEAANEPINATTGWTNIGSGTVAQATGLVTGLTLRWHRYTGSAPSTTFTLTTGNHLVGRIAAFRGCVTAGSPISGTPAVLSDNGTTTSFSIPAGSTAAADCLVIAALATGTDVTSLVHASGWTNASLASPGVTEFFDNWHSTGNGGGFAAAYGGKAALGAYSATTGTLMTGNTKACMSFALQGAAAGAPAPQRPYLNYFAAVNQSYTW
jgi:hypothetical protein